MDAGTETPQKAARRLAAGAIREGFKPEALHSYTNANGESLYWRIRLKHPDGRKWIRPMHLNGGGFALGEPNHGPEGKPLYRLAELAKADPALLVWIVEGEHVADSLARLGLTATTSGSADSTSGADWRPLAGRRCILWPDNDGPGRTYGSEVADRLRALGCQVEAVDVRALGLPPKGDAVDWLALHPDATAAALLALPRAALPSAEASSELPTVELRCAADIQCTPIRWLWPGWLARGKLHILAGSPGTGKTTIALDLAAAVSSGGRWPGGGTAPPGTVLIWSGEDDAADTLVPRLVVAGADLDRIHIIGDARLGDEVRPFDPATDLAALEFEAARRGDVALLIADPVVSAVLGDSHKNTEVRRALQPLVNLGARLGCAVLGISHFTKGSAGRDPTERVVGSIAFGALARVVMVAAKRADDGDGPQRLLARSKSNIGPDGGGFAYDLAQALTGGIEASRVAWGAPLDGTARELLGDIEATGDDETTDAATWLRELLAGGALPAREVRRHADDCGHAWRTVQRAMRRAGVESRRGGFGQPATWGLTSYVTVAPVTPHSEVGANGANGATSAVEVVEL